MKRVLMIATVVFMSSYPLSATSCLQSLSSAISNFGQSIENVDNVPVIGKLVNVLPIAMFAAGLKQCPLQTIAVLAAWGTYKLSQNENVRKMIGTSELVNNPSCTTRNQQDETDENIFVFEGNQEKVGDDVSDNQWFADEDDSHNHLEPEASSQNFL